MKRAGAIRVLSHRLAYLQARLSTSEPRGRSLDFLIGETEALKVALLALGGVEPEADSPIRSRQQRNVELQAARCTCRSCPVHAAKEAAQ